MAILFTFEIGHYSRTKSTSFGSNKVSIFSLSIFFFICVHDVSIRYLFAIAHLLALVNLRYEQKLIILQSTYPISAWY